MHNFTFYKLKKEEEEEEEEKRIVNVELYNAHPGLLDSIAHAPL